ncbi:MULTISPECIES: single-stranded DNA-binding protein [unclassified Cronobacter]|uniref:single-stranded DNA-binding protein n=1 Tax=unclassified Cronobacter TaxID=2649764 RepID=UPI0030DC1337
MSGAIHLFKHLSVPLAAKVLKKVMANTGGNKRQVPAKRQNRGSRNSTDDGG